MKVRMALLIGLLLLGGIGAEWWLVDGTGTDAADVTKMDGGDPPPSPHP